MAERAYVQLVLLTERPGARIGHVPYEALSPTERDVYDVLAWLRSFEHPSRGEDMALLDALREQSPATWARQRAALRRIGAVLSSARTGRALQVAGVRDVDDAAVRKVLVAALAAKYEDVLRHLTGNLGSGAPKLRSDPLGRRMHLLLGISWALDGDDLHQRLMDHVAAHSDDVPGAAEIITGALWD